jgi:hypothetical protein
VQLQQKENTRDCCPKLFNPPVSVYLKSGEGIKQNYNKEYVLLFLFTITMRIFIFFLIIINMKYTVSQLLDINPMKKASLPIEVFRRLKVLNICATKNTHRGRKCAFNHHIPVRITERDDQKISNHQSQKHQNFSTPEVLIIIIIIII